MNLFFTIGSLVKYGPESEPLHRLGRSTEDEDQDVSLAHFTLSKKR